MNRPRLIVTTETKDNDWRIAWEALTWEDRRGMSAKQLAAAMGPMWVNHPKHNLTPRVPRPAIPLPNLVETGRGPNYNIPEVHSFWGLIAAVMKWAAR